MAISEYIICQLKPDRSGRMFDNISRDLANYRNAGWMIHLGFWTGVIYRFGYWCRQEAPKPVGMPLLILYKIIVLPIGFFRCVYIPPGTKIGPGLSLHHPQNIVISSRTNIGKNCSIYHGVTMGGGGAKPGLPTIGDRVTIFSGAKILGGITIGDEVQIGANAVVTTDIPAGSIVPSPTSRIISAEFAKKMAAVRSKTAEKKSRDGH